MSEKISPDKKAILQHLDFLFGDCQDGLIEIAYTPQHNASVSNASFFNVKDIEKAAEFAANQNAKEGSNVYVGAALRRPGTAPFGRSNIEDYYKATAIWCDLDDAQAAKNAKLKYKDFPPSLVVVTGRHPDMRAQVWWKLKEPQENTAEQKEALSKVCGALDGDKAVADSIRVMRLGGTIAWPKKQGRILEKTEIKIPANSIQSIAFADFKNLFPGAPDDKEAGEGGLNLLNPKKDSPLQTQESWTTEQVCQMLSHVHPDSNYIDWLSIGMALKDYGVGFDIFNAWSATGTKYPGIQDLRKKWDSFKGVGVSIGTLYYHAANGGYKPSNYVTGGNVTQNKSVVKPSVKEVIDPETGEIKKVSQRKFYYINAPDINANLNTNDFVQGTLTRGAMSVVYGESNCGKTFFMSDMGFHIVQGKQWNGKRVEKGNVLYICMEGAFGLSNRITAYKKENNVDLNGFLVMPCAINFTAHEDGDVDELLFLMQEANSSLGEISLIVIDTLARAVAGGDENSGQDMGELVRKADIIRSQSGAHICFIHHSGKDKARGARGHSSLRAAVDTEIEISRSESADYSSVKIAKQRDMEKGDDSYFKLKTVELGENRHGEKITSCVVDPYDLESDTYERIEKKIKSGKTRTAYDSLLECVFDKGAIRHSPDLPRTKVVMEDQFKEYLIKRGVLSDNQKSAIVQYGRIKGDLIENDLIVFRDGYLWPKE